MVPDTKQRSFEQIILIQRILIIIPLKVGEFGCNEVNKKCIFC